MRLVSLKEGRYRRALAATFAIAAIASVISIGSDIAFGQRVKGLDTSSAANGTAPSQALWNTAFSQGYQFAFPRSSRGGTSDATRLDDAQFYDNISRAVNSGMLAGSYHYGRADVATHTAADDANHYLQRAGMYMKPGYLLPVFDLEAGNGLSQAALTTWSNEFVDTIFNAKGVYPIVYGNSSYVNDEVSAALAFHNSGTTPKTDPKTYQWLARPGSNGLTGNPPAPSGIPNPYGVWDPNFITRTNSREPAVKPWVFWQQTLDTTPVGLFKIDIDYANGNIEFVKDFLVPALWTNAGSGDWGTTANWNSDNPTYNGTIQSGPAPRLPNNHSLDWVKLQNAGNGTVTISSGARTVRKFYTQQPLNITGGSLEVNYEPGSGGKWDLPSEFNDAVTLSGSGAYSAHTTQVDGGGGVFNLNGGTVTAREIQLASHATNPGRIVVGGDVTFSEYRLTGMSTIRSVGTLAQSGRIELTAGNRTFNVADGGHITDLNIRVPITGDGRLVKSGLGTMQLSSANTYTGGTTITPGYLQISAENQLGSAPVSLQSDNIVLDGGALRTGGVVDSVNLTNAGTAYTSFPFIHLNSSSTVFRAASANVLAGIGSIAVTNGGSGYVNQTPAAPPAANTSGTFVDIVGGGGTGAQAYATVVGGVVTSVTISNPGTGYTSMPSVFISSAVSSGFAGSGVVASVNGITLQGIAINDGGFGYLSPTISFVGGGGSGATASINTNPNITLGATRGVTLTNNSGAFEPLEGTTLTVLGPISSAGNSSLTKRGDGKLVLGGANTYTGGTAVNLGEVVVSGAIATLGTGNVSVGSWSIPASLRIESGVLNAISDSATLSLLADGLPNTSDEGRVILEAGINELIGALILGGVTQEAGMSYGSTASAAMIKNDVYFTGTGMVTVVPEPSTLTLLMLMTGFGIGRRRR